VQIRVSPVDIGNVEPTALTLTGTGVEAFPVVGQVFETPDGWGAEIAVDVSALLTPSAGDVIGIQAHLNGSSGNDRDIKVIWSVSDVDDTSFRDPSVFGQGVFVAQDGSDESAADETVGDETAEREAGDGELTTEDETESTIAEVESESPGGDEVITAEEQQRSLLLAAIASSVAVVLGGLWFERKRRSDEARHAAAAGSAAGVSGDDTDGDLDDEEYEQLLQSILEDGDN